MIWDCEMVVDGRRWDNNQPSNQLSHQPSHPLISTISSLPSHLTIYHHLTINHLIFSSFSLLEGWIHQVVFQDMVPYHLWIEMVDEIWDGEMVISSSHNIFHFISQSVSPSTIIISSQIYLTIYHLTNVSPKFIILFPFCNLRWDMRW